MMIQLYLNYLLQFPVQFHTNNQPIPGLYAAGEVAFTGLFDAEYPCCGMAIGSAVYYGRIAAESAVEGK